MFLPLNFLKIRHFEKMNIHNYPRPPPAVIIFGLTVGLLAVLLLWFGSGRESLQAHNLSGSAFGTSWSLKIALPSANLNKQEIQERIQQILDKVDRQMSTHRDDSQISHFNRSRSLEWFPVSAEFSAVVQLHSK